MEAIVALKYLKPLIAMHALHAYSSRHNDLLFIRYIAEADSDTVDA